MTRSARGLVCLIAALLTPGPSAAALRSPQVPVLGGVLQAYLNGVGENIAVNTEQQAQQTWMSTVMSNATFTIQVELRAKSPDVSFGLYNAGDPVPTLFEVLPKEASAGWFAVVSFRTNPVRAIVTTFDQSSALRSSTTDMGADRNAFAFGQSGPGGTFFTQDARNPGGRAQFLVYAGTGINSGAWWLAGEDTALDGGGSDQGFDDTVVYLFAENCPCPAQHCTWGALRERFR